MEADDILCEKNCDRDDIYCMYNKTRSVSYQFLALPMIPELKWPVVLINITAHGFALIPQMYFYIFSGNDEDLFDTKVYGDTGTDLCTYLENTR